MGNALNLVWEWKAVAEEQIFKWLEFSGKLKKKWRLWFRWICVCVLGQWFSNFSMSKYYPEGVYNFKYVDLTPRDSDSAGLRWDAGFWSSNKAILIHQNYLGSFKKVLMPPPPPPPQTLIQFVWSGAVALMSIF